MDPHINTCYVGRDIRAPGQQTIARFNHTREEAIQEAMRIGAKVIIESRKNDGGGYYYLKGMNMTWDECQIRLANSRIVGNRRGWQVKYAWLLNNN